MSLVQLWIVFKDCLKSDFVISCIRLSMEGFCIEWPHLISVNVFRIMISAKVFWSEHLVMFSKYTYSQVMFGIFQVPTAILKFIMHDLKLYDLKLTQDASSSAVFHSLVSKWSKFSSNQHFFLRNSNSCQHISKKMPASIWEMIVHVSLLHCSVSDDYMLRSNLCMVYFLLSMWIWSMQSPKI